MAGVRAVLDGLDPPPRYYILGFEVCPETHRPHIQGYVELSQRGGIEFRRMKRLLGPDGQSWNLQPREGTQQQAIDYCKKDGQFVEFGSPSVAQQGRRSDLEEMVAAARTLTSFSEVITAYPSLFVRYHAGMEKLYARLHTFKDLDAPPTVTLVYGTSGYGKSWYVSKVLYPDSSKVYIPTSKNSEGGAVWFDRYDGQPVIWLRDFGRNCLPLDVWKNLCDVFVLRIQGKGTSYDCRPTDVVMCSNSLPGTWWKDLNEVELGAVTRRINRLFICPAPRQIVQVENPQEWFRTHIV